MLILLDLSVSLFSSRYYVEIEKISQMGLEQVARGVILIITNL